MQTMRHKKDYLRVIKLVDSAPGWNVKKLRTNHYMIFPPDKDARPYTASRSPSDHRSQKNLEAWLKRNGLDLAA